MLQLMKLLEPSTKPEPAASEQTLTDDPGFAAVSGQDMDKNDDDSGDWEQVGPRNKSSITRMVCVQAPVTCSPVTQANQSQENKILVVFLKVFS